METGSTEADVEAQRGRELLLRLLRIMLGLAVLAFVASRLDPSNDLVTGIAFYGPTIAMLGGLHVLARRGWVKLTALSLAIFFWVLVAVVTLLFGGLVGQNAALFSVSVVLAATLVGGRAALGLTIASSCWVGFLVYLHAAELLPVPISPVTPINGAISISTTLVLLWALVQTTIRSLREANERTAESARLRDEALRRSIESQKLQAVGTLASGIAHDFNNLLAVIGSAAFLLRKEADGTPGAAPLLDDVDAATMRAGLMTRQLLAFARPHDGTPVPVDVGEAVRALAPMLPRLLGSSITVDVETVSGAVALATRAGLEQILLNLAVNARDAMPDGGRLSIRVAVDGADVVLRVTDTGVGMNEEEKRRAFEAFFTTKKTGTGLGLATVRDQVARYEGRASVESAPGKGATFEIRLPRRAPVTSAAQPESTSFSAKAAAPARLLLVEDNALVRRGLQRTLESAGFDVVSVSNGLEALGVIEKAGELAVVVTDISMPGLDGASLAQKLAVSHPELPVVLVSGNLEPTDETLAAPRRAFVDKTAPPTQILQAIERVRRPS